MSILSSLKSLHLSYRNIFCLMVAISILSLCFAFFVEYVLNIPPCTLCIYQRIPYAFIIIIGLLGIFTDKFYNIFFALIMVAILSSIFISGYHSSVERGFMAGTALCNPGLIMPDNLSVEQIKEMLYNREVATCTKAPFKIMFLSMAEWNCLFNIGLLMFCLSLRRRNI